MTMVMMMMMTIIMMMTIMMIMIMIVMMIMISLNTTSYKEPGLTVHCAVPLPVAPP